MSQQNKKKMGYKQYEKLLALAHQKSEILAQRVQTLQSYLVTYIEYSGDMIEFNDFINKRVIKEQNELTKKEGKVNEKV
jgi:hypothetical protein